MKNFQVFVTSILIIVLFYSCYYLMPSCTDGFEIYKKHIEQKSKYTLRIDNGYYSGNNYSGRFFFANGKTKSAIFNFDNGKDMILNEFLTRENWAEYSIIGDSIIIQGFNHHNQELCRRWVFETKGLITSDTSILLLSMYDYRFNTIEMFDPPFLISYIPSSMRPDSTIAWYLNKSWFINNVHPSRK